MFVILIPRVSASTPQSKAHRMVSPQNQPSCFWGVFHRQIMTESQAYAGSGELRSVQTEKTFRLESEGLFRLVYRRSLNPGPDDQESVAKRFQSILSAFRTDPRPIALPVCCTDGSAVASRVFFDKVEFTGQHDMPGVVDIFTDGVTSLLIHGVTIERITPEGGLHSSVGP